MPRAKQQPKPVRRPDHDDKIRLIAVHEDSRREKIKAAYLAVVGLLDEDMAMVVRWRKAGKPNEAELGCVLAAYRRALGESYGTAGVE